MKLRPDGDRAARIAPRRTSRQQHLAVSPDAVEEVIAGVPCRIDASLEWCRP